MVVTCLDVCILLFLLTVLCILRHPIQYIKIDEMIQQNKLSAQKSNSNIVMFYYIY